MRLQFKNFHDALHAGFMCMERIPEGYLMRKVITTRSGRKAWQMAVVTIAVPRCENTVAKAAYLWNVCTAVTTDEDGDVLMGRGWCDEAGRNAYLRFGTIPAEELTTRLPYLIDYFGEAA